VHVRAVRDGSAWRLSGKKNGTGGRTACGHADWFRDGRRNRHHALRASGGGLRDAGHLPPSTIARARNCCWIDAATPVGPIGEALPAIRRALDYALVVKSAERSAPCSVLSSSHATNLLPVGSTTSHRRFSNVETSPGRHVH